MKRYGMYKAALICLSLMFIANISGNPFMRAGRCSANLGKKALNSWTNLSKPQKLGVVNFSLASALSVQGTQEFCEEGGDMRAKQLILGAKLWTATGLGFVGSMCFKSTWIGIGAFAAIEAMPFVQIATMCALQERNRKQAE